MLEFINREELKDVELNEVSIRFQKLVDEYCNDIEGMDLEAIKAEEKRLIEVMKKWDETLQGIKYVLPKTISFGGNSELTRTMVGKYICELLEKLECEYKYTLGYYQMWKLWKKPPATITYNELNSTLQGLGNGMRFRGPHQWELILTINEFFKPLHNDYQKDNLITILYGTCHSHLLDRMKVLDPQQVNPDQEAEQGHINME